MKNFLILMLASLTLAFSSCNNNSGNSNSIVGTWKEYRSDPNDNYGLGTWKFNADGSGYFKVTGYTNIQKMGFIWDKTGSTIKVNTNDGNPITLELNNGLLIENGSAFGPTVYKKVR